jgi:dienelactone hydrolase
MKRILIGLALVVAVGGTTVGALGGGAAGRGPGGGAAAGLTSRIQDKTYVFADTNENMPYSVFVSSKVTKEKKAPLVICLRGANGNPRSVLVNNALQQAEEGGYILAGVMGYAPMGGFGMDMGSMGGRGGGARGRGGATAPATTRASATTSAAASVPATTTATTTAGARGAARGGRSSGGTAVTDTAEMSKMSEKDLLYVLEIVKKDYNVDEKRVYLLGHSLGGGGAIFLGEKYPEKFAGVVALSPGIFGFQFTEKSKYKELPLMILVGANDTMIASVQQWEEKIKALNIGHEYKEVPGFDHGGIINGGMEETFKFLGKHVKGETKGETKAEGK